MINEVQKINNTLSVMFDKEYVTFTQNATTAMWALLKALEIRGRKIVIPVNVCFVVPCAIILSGNIPIFLDIDKSYSISPDLLEKLSDPEISAVIYPNNYGNVGELEQIISIANRKNWLLIEDTCPALGAKYKEKYVGSFTDYSFTSFGQGKILDINAGGAVTVNDNNLHNAIGEIISKLKPCSIRSRTLYESFNRFYAEAVTSIENDEDMSDFGKAISFAFKDGLISGLNIDTLTLNFLANEINNIDHYVEVTTKNADYYQSIINMENVEVLAHSPGSAYWRQNILVPKKSRDDLMGYLRSNNVKVSKYFPSIDRCFYSRESKNVFKKSDQMYSSLINLWPGHHTKYPDILRLSSLLDKYF
jgi:dTDP-4-amino-4,6-dideoxygalactose transaminase